MPTAPGLPLVRAAHPRRVVAVATVLAVAAALTGRPLREVALVAATVLVGQAVLGWLDDLADRDRDARREPSRPLPSGRVDAGTVWFAVACGVLLVVPLAVANGRNAALAYLAALVVAAVGDRLLHARALSFVPWVVGFALYPSFLAYGGWGGVGSDTPPAPAVTALAGALGLTVHVLLALPGLVQDHEEGERSFPLLVALRTGTPRLLVLASVATGLLAVGLLFAGRSVGLT